MENFDKHKKHPFSKVVVSNRIEDLRQSLKKNLYFSDKTFCRKLVITNSDEIKNALAKDCCLDENLQIFSGVRFTNLNLAVQYLYQLVCRQRSNFPKKLSLSMYLETFMQKQNLFNDYFEGKQTKKIAFANRLAQNFLQYGLYTKDFSTLKEKSSWQYEILKESEKKFSYPNKHLHFTEKDHPEIFQEVHIFGFSHIPKVYLDFFKKISSFFPITYYFLSPSKEYWGDIVSDYTTHKLYKNIQEDSQSLKEGFKQYFTCENPLLKTLASEGKALFNFFYEQNFIIDDEGYKNAQANTTLSCIQNDLLEIKKTPHLNADKSVQMNVCTTKFREVQVLLNFIQTIMKRERYTPQDFGVFVSDISAYSPYIEFVFEENECPFGYEISGVNALERSRYLDAVFHLFTICETNFSVEDVCNLLDNEYVQKRCDFQISDITQIKRWIRKASIKWGYSETHFMEIANNSKQDEGSWLLGLERLCFAIASDEVSDLDLQVPISASELLSKFLSFVQDLYKDWYQLKHRNESLKFWHLHLQQLLQDYVAFPEESDEESSYAQLFQGALEQVRQAYEITEDELYSFVSVKERILETMNSLSSSIKSDKEKPKITFKSLNSQIPKEYKVIYLLGMDESFFPKKETTDSLYVVDACDIEKPPSKTQKDNWVLLSALLSARDYFVVSYAQQSDNPQMTMHPSVFIEALSNYPITVCHHKNISFDKAYFQDESTWQNFSKRDASLANMYYNKNKRFSNEELSNVSIKAIVKPEEIDLKQLQGFASNPIKYFINKHLGMYLTDIFSNAYEEEFIVSLPQKYRVVDMLLKLGFEKTLQVLQASPQLPTGLFKSHALFQLKRDIYQIDQSLKSLQLDTKKLFYAFFHENYDLSSKEYPPVIVQLESERKVKIVGELGPLYEDGLVYEGDDSFSSLLKIWPKLLLFCSICEEPKIYCLQNAKVITCPKFDYPKLLTNYLSYFEHFTKEASLLMPKWAEALLLKEEKDALKAISNSYGKYKKAYKDPYVHWLHSDAHKVYRKIKADNFVCAVKEKLQGFLSWYETI